MKIKIKSTQIYEDSIDENEEIYEDCSINILDKIIMINYNNVNEIIFDKENNTVKIKSVQNNIFLELNKENEVIYSTPYGNINIKTVGEKFEIIKKPVSMHIEYKITLNNQIGYKNIVEIIEV